MMGVQAASARLFYDFCLDDHVPSDHLLRSIDRHLDFEGLRQTLKPFYSQIGRPSIDPELMIRMLIVGYCMGIRSERRLCEEVHLNLAYRWFCRLGLDGKVPDHSTFSKNRHGRFRESDAAASSVRERRSALHGGRAWSGADGFAVDASLIAADANKQRSVPSKDWKPEEIKENAVRAAREYLATLDDAAFGAASPVTPKFISPIRSGGPMDGRAQGACLLRLRRQLSDRHRPRRDCRRRSDAGHPAGRGRGGSDDARADGDPLWHEARLPDRRQRLWFSGEPGLARQTERDHAAHPCLRQVQSDRRHVLPRRLRLRSRTRPLHVPCGQGAGPVPAHLRQPHEAASRPRAQGSIAPANWIATSANSKPSAARTRSPARSRGICTRTPATWLVRSPRRRNTWTPVAGGRRSRCCSPISSESFASRACA